MARNTLAALITKTRQLIDDTDPSCYAFTDDQIQDALDDRRDEARYYALTEHETISQGGGTTTYLTFTAPVGAWESPALVDSTYTTLTPATSDLWTGRWTFSTEPKMPVMLTGFTYDVYGAAGDLLLNRATNAADSFDVSADGLSVSRSQVTAALQARAYDLLAKARTRSITLIRTDENPC